MPDVIDLAGAAAQQRDPGTGLRSVAALREAADQLEAAHVSSALRDGWSWSRIAKALGVTKQAAHKKHARRPRRQPSEVELHQLLIGPAARRVVVLARSEAASCRDERVGTEHLLAGILTLEEGPAVRALTSLEISLTAVRDQAAAFRNGDGPDGKPRRRRHAGKRRAARLPLSRRAREGLEQAMREMVGRGDRLLEPEHLLLALLRDPSACGVQV